MGSRCLVGAQAENSSSPETRLTRSKLWAAIILWSVLLFASDLPGICAQHLRFQFPPWASPARASVLALAALLVWRSRRFPYLHSFIFSITALLTGDWLQGQIESSIPWFRSAPHAFGMFARVFLTLIPAGLMALTLIASGFTRRDVFLATGNLRAPGTFPLLRGVRWNLLAPVLLIFMSVGLISQLWVMSHASGHFRPKVLLIGLPAAIVFAAVNSSCEEFRFRCVLLAQGSRSVSMTQALAATSLLFGFAHFNGHPSGVSGVVMASFLAWVVAKSMVDTGGWGWAWFMHFVEDVIIFLMVLMTGV